MIVAVKSKTVQRAEVIAKRTGNIAEGFLKSQMIDLLKEKMKNGVAHFVFKKKDGEVREAWVLLGGSYFHSHLAFKIATQSKYSKKSNKLTEN